MKKLYFVISALLIALFTAPMASAADVAINITAPTHRQFDGLFIDDELAAQLAYEGRLGQLVFNPARGNRSWFIDPQLIEEVTAMASDYSIVGGEKGVGSEVAKNWLNQLSAITRGDRITALPYGNPSGYWISKMVPSAKDFYLKLGAKRLTALLNRQVSQLDSYPENKAPKLEYLTVRAFRESQRILKLNSPYLSLDEVEKFQGYSAAVLHPDLKAGHRTMLDLDLLASTAKLGQRIRLAPGRFTVTSTKQNLPITLINDFPNPVKLSIEINALNGKVLVGTVPNQIVNGNSKIQVMIPVEVVTSGESELSVSMYSEGSQNSRKKALLGEEVIYPVTLKVISPIATWITTGGAIILFVSALIQSFRRIRKKRS